MLRYLQTKRFQRLLAFAAFTVICVVFVRKVAEPKTPLVVTYDQLFGAIRELKPDFEPLTAYHDDQKVKQKFASDKDFYFSKEYLSKVLKVTPENVADLRLKHSAFVSLVTKGQLGALTGSIARGILYVGGGRFSWLDLLSIQQLRRLGARLPVEVFIPSEDDYEYSLCEEILPKLNARCMVLPRLIPEEALEGLTITGYQYKSLALLVSRFEEILFLDSDNVPVSNVDLLFDREPFRSTKAVFWPDSWARTTHPQLYDIMDLPVNEKVKVRGNERENLDPQTSHFHDFEGTLENPTCETGVFMISKKTHQQTLLLSLYYNIYGPGYYYPLMSQGGAGEGDKETFVFAAFVLKQPVYRVLKLAWWIGYHHNGFQSKALAQHDAPSDWKNENLAIKDEKKVDVGFMHMAYPKLFPEKLYGEVIEGSKHHRLYEGLSAKVGYDFELTMWKLMSQSLCEVSDFGVARISVPGLENVKMVSRELQYFKGQNLASHCKFLTEHTQWLESNPE